MPAMYALPLIVMDRSPPLASWPCILLQPRRSRRLTPHGASHSIFAMLEPLVAYLHYLSIIFVGGFLIAELVMCRAGMTSQQAQRLAIVDAGFFASAMAALATGLLRFFFYAKGVSFYTGNPAFWAKMALYVIIATISIKPTRTFLRWKRAATVGGIAPDAAEIASARRLIHIELGLLALMPLMAVLMARGIGR